MIGIGTQKTGRRLRIPPTKLFARGQLSERMLRLIRANVRHPDILVADLFAEITAFNTAEAELQAIAARLGPRRETAAAGAILGSGRRRRSTMTRKRER